MNTFSMAHFNDDNAASEFMETGYTLLDVHPEVQILLTQQLFKELDMFFKQDKKYIDQWQFDLGLIGKPDTGPVFRKDEENKKFFHGHRLLRHALFLRGVKVNLFEDLLNLYEQVNNYAHKRLVRFLKALLPLLNKEFTGTPTQLIEIERFTNEESLALSVGRALLYEYKDSGKEIAEKHEDQSGLTLHFFQSHSGLFLDNSENLYSQAPGKALVFPGKKFELLTGGEQYYEETETASEPKTKGGLVKALPHGVVSLPSAQEYIRTALVYFMHPSGVDLLPKKRK